MAKKKRRAPQPKYVDYQFQAWKYELSYSYSLNDDPRFHDDAYGEYYAIQLRGAMSRLCSPLSPVINATPPNSGRFVVPWTLLLPVFVVSCLCQVYIWYLSTWAANCGQLNHAPTAWQRERAWYHCPLPRIIASEPPLGVSRWRLQDTCFDCWTKR